jgi:periplasmic protein TonB
MATRAFLLCGDEKAVQAVTQILDELEVSFEHSSEPAFSLKRLGTQRFDLLIVDCDNAQNATQVFNSARASNLNKTSIAIAIVEGKAGVPNAFRLGASLVLTKPVSLEQTRNTVRTGIGMTRKETQEARPAASAITLPATPPHSISVPPVFAAAPSLPTTPVATPPAQRPPATPAVLSPVAPPAPPALKPIAETPKPTVTTAPAAEKPATMARPAMVPVMPAQERKPALTNFTEKKNSSSIAPTSGAKIVPPIAPIPAKTVATTAAPTPASKNFDSVFNTPSATDDAKSKTAASKSEVKAASDKDAPILSIVDPLAEEDVLDPVRDHGVPSFGAIGKDSFAGIDHQQSKGGRGWLIAAIVLLFVTAGGYGAWATQPEFHKFVAWEYLNAMSRIASLRGQSQTVAQKEVTPAPAPLPVAPPPVPAVTDPATVSAPSDPMSTAAEPNTALNMQPNSQLSASATSAADPTTPKSASVQPAKQDAAGNHPAANPTLVPTSLPTTPVAKAPSSELLEVPEDFADDQIVHRVHPTYPKQARTRKLHGTVVLEAIVNKKGSVDSLQLVSGDSMLAQAAADAVKQWKYKPYLHNGEVTEFQTRITIDFKLP